MTPGFDRAAWERLAVGSPLQRAEWLEVMQTRIPGQVHTVTHGAGLAFLGAVVSDPEAYESYNPPVILWRDPPVFGLADAARRRAGLNDLDADRGDLLPAFVLVVPGYVGEPAGAAAGDPVTVRECLRGVADWCRGRGLVGLHLLYADAGTALQPSPVAAAVAALGGVSYPLTTRWRLPVWWDSWDEYVGGLPTQQRREVNRELRRAAEAGIIPGPVDPRADAERILDARCDVLRRHGQPVDRSSESRRLRRLIEVFGPDLSAYGAYRDGALVAASVGVRQGRSMHLVYAGTTEAAHRLPYTHFVAAFYAVAGGVSRRDLDEIDYGIGNGVGKALRGCQPRPLHGHAIGLDSRQARLVSAAAALLTECAYPLPDYPGGAPQPVRASTDQLTRSPRRNT